MVSSFYFKVIIILFYLLNITLINCYYTADIFCTKL